MICLFVCVCVILFVYIKWQCWNVAVWNIGWGKWYLWFGLILPPIHFFFLSLFYMSLSAVQFSWNGKKWFHYWLCCHLKCILINYPQHSNCRNTNPKQKFISQVDERLLLCLFSRAIYLFVCFFFSVLFNLIIYYWLLHIL